MSTWIGTKGYVGGAQDASTGLENLGARDYNPATGRFLSTDPVLEAKDPTQLAGYDYAGNDPITSSDPTGLTSCDVTGNCGTKTGVETPTIKQDEQDAPPAAELQYLENYVSVPSCPNSESCESFDPPVQKWNSGQATYMDQERKATLQNQADLASVADLTIASELLKHWLDDTEVISATRMRRIGRMGMFEARAA